MAGLNDQLIEAHVLLGNFLQNYLKQIGGPSTTVATARIVRLPLEHLNELANDLTDEADRRTNSLNGFLPTRSDLLPKRNEVRQRLATLPENRFNDLCAQVYFEIEKRIPVPKVAIAETKQRVQSSRVRSPSRESRVRDTFIIPKREATPSVDSSRRRRDPSRESQRYTPRNSSRVRRPSRDITNEFSPLVYSEDEMSKIKSDYEYRIKVLEDQASGEDYNATKFQQLQADYDTLKMKHSNCKKDYDLISDDLKREQKTTSDLQAKLSALKKANQLVEKDFVESKKSLDAIRAESKFLVADVKSLTEKLRVSESEKAILDKTLQQVQSELDSALEKLHSSGNNGNTDKQNHRVTFSKEDIVKETQPKTKLIAKYENILVDFEKYSDELMTATKDQKMSALPAMKSIVLLCQKLTDESEKKEDDNLATDEDRRNLVKAKDSVNGTLQKLMELTKSHRMRPSESTSRDIQVTVSKLSLYITDLLEAFENFDHKVKRASVRLSKPVDDELPPMALSELKVYLNDQMDEMAHSIKDLVAAMKQSDSTEDQIIQYINEIADNVDNIVYETQGSIDNSNLKRNVIEDTDDILAKLSEVRLDILDYGDVLVEDLKDQFTKQKITNATYDIAKFAKELMKILY